MNVNDYAEDPEGFKVIPYSAIFTSLLFIAVAITYNMAFLHPFDEWKALLLYLFAGVFSVVSIWTNREERFSWNLLSISCCIYILFSLLSLTAKNAPVYEGLVSVAKILLMFGLAYSISRISTNGLKFIFSITTAVACAVALIVWTRPTFFNFLRIDQLFVYPIGHISYFSDYLLANLPIAMLLVVLSRGASKLVWSLAITSLTAVLWISGTRASIVGFGVFLIAATILLLKFKLANRTSCIFIAGALLFSALLIFVIKPAPIRVTPTEQRLESIVTEDLAVNDRVIAYKKALIASKDDISFGHGIGSFRFVYPAYAYKGQIHSVATAKSWFMHPHNEIINHIFEVGIAGTIAALLIIFSLFFGATKFLLKSGETPKRQIMLFTIAGFIGILASLQFSTSFLFPLTRLSMCLYAAIMIKYGREYLPKFFSTRRILTATLLTVFFVFVTFFTAAYSASLYASTRAMRTKNSSQKIAWAKTAYTLAPGGFYPLFALSSVSMRFLDLSSTKKVIDEMFRQFPEVQVVLQAKAMSELKAGNGEKAKELLEKAIQNDPSFESAKQLLSTINSSK